MPIYAYRCDSCGYAQDVLQKISDPRLTVCPACGAASFSKQITAAGFQLKGTGWYVTDFKGSGAAKPAPDAKPTDSKPAADGASAAPASPAPAEGSVSAPSAGTTPAAGSGGGTDVKH